MHHTLILLDAILPETADAIDIAAEIMNESKDDKLPPTPKIVEVAEQLERRWPKAGPVESGGAPWGATSLKPLCVGRRCLVPLDRPGAERCAAEIVAIANRLGLAVLDPDEPSFSLPYGFIGYTLEVENARPLHTPGLTAVERAIDALDGPQTPSFASLNAIGGSYVQCGGGPSGGYIVEWRVVEKDGFRHLSAGKSARPAGPGLVHVPMSGGGVRVPENEKLTARDAKRIFVAFAHGEPPPADWFWRDRTAEFRKKR